MYYPILIIDYATLFILAICVLVISIQQSSYSQKLMANIGSWSFFAVFGFCIKISSYDLTGQIIGQKMVYCATLNIFLYMLLFILNYFHYKLHYWSKTLLVLNNFVLSASALLLDKGTFFYKTFSYEEVDGFPVLSNTYGPVHILYNIEILIYEITMIFIILRYIFKSKTADRRSCVLLIIALSIPSLAYIIHKYYNTPYDLVPAGFLFSSIIILYLIYIVKIYDVSDMARDYIFEAIDSAFIITDENYRYKACNNLAQLIFPELEKVSLDENIYTISSRLRHIINGDREQINYNGRVYEPSIRQINAGKSVLGNVVWIEDVTTQSEFKALQDSYREELEAEVEKQTQYANQRHKKIEQMSMQMVQTLANTIDAKDKYTNGHSTRVAEYSVRIARELGWDKESLDMLRYEGLLHDIGKIGIPDTILNKPSHLNDNEFHVIQSHTIMGGNILQDTSTLPGAENVIRHHHEKYDGTGYPLGLKGEQIPLDARIVGIADSYDAMSSNRIYRKALPKDIIREELLKGRGKQFDPKILDIFITMFDKGVFDDVAPADNGWER